MKKKESNSLGLKNKPEPKRAPVYFTYYNYLLFFRNSFKISELQPDPRPWQAELSSFFPCFSSQTTGGWR